MGDFFNRYKNFIMIVIAAVVLFIGYNYFFAADDTTGPALTSNTSGATTADLAEQELLSILLRLREINLDATVFEDELFRSLQDFSQELRPEPVGRNNPFAPIGVGGSPVPEDGEATEEVTEGEEEPTEE